MLLKSSCFHVKCIINTIECHYPSPLFVTIQYIFNFTVSTDVQDIIRLLHTCSLSLNSFVIHFHPANFKLSAQSHFLIEISQLSSLNKSSSSMVFSIFFFPFIKSTRVYNYALFHDH